MPQIDTERLEKYADIVYNRANYFNDYTLQTIGRRIKNIGELSAYDQQTLKNMADISGDMEAITKELARITELNIADIEEIYSKTVEDGVNSYKPLYDFKGMKFVPLAENEYAKFLVNHWAAATSETIVNLSRTKALCFTKYDAYGNVVDVTPLEGAFQKAIDDAVIAKASGTVDFQTAMRETIKQLGGSGVRVNYGSGVTRSIESMVRQNLLYGAKQAALAYDDYIGEELGCDGFEVDYHPNARPSHVFMGGEMFSYKGDVTIDGKTYKDGAKALARLGDYGCLHFKINVILGISESAYDRKWLDEQKAKDSELIEYNGIEKTGYEWKRSQRRIERMVRNERNTATLAEAAGDKTLVRNANEKIAAYSAKYNDLCAKTGLQPTLERMATVMEKSLTTVDNIDDKVYNNIRRIVRFDNQSIREWYVSVVSDIPNQIDKRLPFEAQARRAFDLRNQYKYTARVAMSDREAAKGLNKKKPVLTFDELLKDKMKRKKITEEEALVDIFETASKTNPDVNKEFGIGGE